MGEEAGDSLGDGFTNDQRRVGESRKASIEENVGMLGTVDASNIGLSYLIPLGNRESLGGEGLALMIGHIELNQREDLLGVYALWSLYQKDVEGAEENVDQLGNAKHDSERNVQNPEE